LTVNFFILFCHSYLTPTTKEPYILRKLEENLKKIKINSQEMRIQYNLKADK